MDSNMTSDQGSHTLQRRFGVDRRRRYLHDEQADYPCQDIEEMYLLNVLAGLCHDKRTQARSATTSVNNEFLSNPRRDLFLQALRWMSAEGYDFGTAYSIASTVFTKVSLNHQQSISEPSNSNLVKRVLDAVERKEKDRDKLHLRRDPSNTELEVIDSPYKTLPRRIWDIRSNRVIPFSLLTIKQIQYNRRSGAWEVKFTDRDQDPPPEFWAVSHSWVEETQAVMTPANSKQWPVPLPPGVHLSQVRRELLRFGAKYVWLDVLCLRQHVTFVDQAVKPQKWKRHEEIRQQEWKLDVPTIGNIYRIATIIVRYFNGLGCKFSSENWDDKRHWLQRAWTLQELRSEEITYNGGVQDSTNLWNTSGVFDRKETTLRQAMTPLWELAQHLDLNQEKSHGEIYRLVKEMRRRSASNELDKVSGLFYLLRTTSLPAYLKGTPARKAWEKCFHVLADQTQLELLFDFPDPGTGGNWFPSWEQLLEWPDRDPALQHQTRQVELDVRHTRFIGCDHLGSNHRRHMLLIKNPYILPDVTIQHIGAHAAGEYVIRTSKLARNSSGRTRIVAQKDIHFQRVYQEHKKIPEGMYHLLTPQPNTSHNWVVCEPFWEWRAQSGPSGNCPGECICKWHGQILKKVGVLRTDFVISLTGSDSTLENCSECLFV